MNNVKSLKDDDVKLEVIELNSKGMSGAAIAREMGMSSRAVQEFLSKDTWEEWWRVYDLKIKPINNSLSESYKSELTKLKIVNDAIENVNGKDFKKITVKDNTRILLISDMHIPFHHPDTLAFLQYLKDKYKPTRVICGGDELDFHALSFHDSDPDLPSAGDELRAALPTIKLLKEMFPVMDILESNHGSMLYRKANHHGVPRQYLKSYNQVLEVDENWEWHVDMVIDLPNGNKCYLHHGKSNNVTKTSQTMSMSAVQFHYHETFKVEYWANPVALYWALQCGCLIDDKKYAFNYNNVNLKRPIIGTGLIIDSMPVLEPMVLNSEGRWVGH